MYSISRVWRVLNLSQSVPISTSVSAFVSLPINYKLLYLCLFVCVCLSFSLSLFLCLSLSVSRSLSLSLSLSLFLSLSDMHYTHSNHVVLRYESKCACVMQELCLGLCPCCRSVSESQDLAEKVRPFTRTMRKPPESEPEILSPLDATT